MIDLEHLVDSGELFDNKYRLLRTLNTDGGTADVWLALDARTIKKKEDLEEAPYLEESYLSSVGLLVAIKIYRPKNALDIEGREKFTNEYMIVFNCHHSNLIHPTEFSIYNDIPYLVLPYCQKGSSELLVGSMTSNEDIWKYILDVASGLAYLHRSNPPIIHQDIKPANVLIDDYGNYAITDFGISEKHKMDDSDDGDEERSGTSAYMSPERFDPDFEASKESDVWAFGATLYELIAGKVPFGEDGGSAQPDGDVFLEFPKSISSGIQKVVCACLNKDPKRRPTAEMLAKAAQSKKYPVGKIDGGKLLLAVAIFVIAIGIVSFFVFLPEEKIIEKSVVVEAEKQGASLETSYGEAVLLMNSQNVDTLKLGLAKLEEVAAQNYIPALYELALTYGWDDKERSVKRKKLLGIKLGNSKVPIDGQYLPVSDEYNDKAIKCFTQIVETLNPAYTEKNMQSALHLGNYYWYLKADKKVALKYFELAKKESNKLPDTEYVRKVHAMVDYYKSKK
jgi:hypothetical protein